MNSFETQNDDVIDLGAVQEETRGASILGDEDVETNQRFLVFGLASED
ncbi:benenodin family lasso peptide [Blastomonas aquatica]|uniref:Benenodin family lasso peptide n=1 Tax=Blastomonas aquatica TaxID=1510276 RepID=A0ABQ1JS32_9SPHN|nr:benenodin family lasso peptide [Blastomonas aquatica]GGB72873.1 hypothetical protein GCM10010833_30080 [Blastomonas aquatica]